jgi:hypothetical protein
MSTRQSGRTPWWLTAVLVLLFVLSLGYLDYGNLKSGMEPTEVALTSFLLAIPLLLLYFSIGVLVTAALQRRSQGQISPRLAKFIFWTPRIAGIVIVLFVSSFALDVFGMEGSIWEKIVGFIIHMLPSILMSVFIALAWKRDWLGFVGFTLAAILFLRTLLGNPESWLGMLLLFSGPMAAIAALFWASWKWKNEPQPTQTLPS